jgi:hypothetical protein
MSENAPEGRIALLDAGAIEPLIGHLFRNARENGRDGVLATGSRGAAHLPTA